MEPFIRLRVLDECCSLWLQNEKRQLETALVVEGQQGAGLKRSISSELTATAWALVWIGVLRCHCCSSLGQGALRLSVAGWCLQAFCRCHCCCTGAASDSEEQLAEYERQESGVVGGEDDEEMSSDGEDVSGGGRG